LPSAPGCGIAVEHTRGAEQRGGRIAPQQLFRDRPEPAQCRAERRQVALEHHVGQPRFQIVTLSGDGMFDMQPDLAVTLLEQQMLGVELW
jgi:hypothetical protein